MDERRQRYLDAMGIQVWQRREAPLPPDEPMAEEPPPVDEAPAFEESPPHEEPPPFDEADYAAYAPPSPEEELPSAGSDVGGLDWDALAARVTGCRQCDELVANRTQTVFGTGDRSARWMVVGEAPGADEDRQGEPFVGRAGQLLNAMLQAAGLKREEVYIANVLKSRPPNNRDPRPEEVANCIPYLRRQIALIRPRVLLVVGRIAAQNLLGSDQPIGRLRGQVLKEPESGIPVVVTYHPAYLLRSPGEKRKAWDDLRLALRVLRGPEGG